MSDSQSSAGKRTQKIPGTFITSSLPGQRFEVTSVPQPANAGTSHSDNPAGAPGSYRVVFALHRPSTSLDAVTEINCSQILEGDSYLQLKADIRADIQVIGSAGIRVLLKRNRNGFFAKIETDPFPAKNFADAKRIAYEMIAPTLSQWSTEANVPLVVYRTDAIELATESCRTDVVVPFSEIQFVPPPSGIGPKLRGYVSLYREALNSNCPAYSFLCLYRILEGLINDRGQRGAKARADGTDPPKYRIWRVPSKESHFIPWLHALYRLRPNWDSTLVAWMFPEEARGEKITKVINNLYDLRCKIAHAIAGDPDDEEKFWADSLDYTIKIESWMPLTQMIARRLLKDEFPNEFLVGVSDDGLDDLYKDPT